MDPTRVFSKLNTKDIKPNAKGLDRVLAMKRPA